MLKKLEELHQSVQRLETVLQEVWSLVDELKENNEYKELKKSAKQFKSNELMAKLKELDDRLDEIPEDGTSAVDLEDAISELIEWIKEN